MVRTIRPKTDLNGNTYLLMEDFRDIINIKQVKYYQVKTKDDNSFTVQFYDKNKKLMRPNVKKS